MTDYRDMSDDALFDFWCDACREVSTARDDVLDVQEAKYNGSGGLLGPSLASAHCVLDRKHAKAAEIYDELKERENSKLAMLVNDDELYDRYLDLRSDIIDRLCEMFGVPPSFKPTTDRYSIDYAYGITIYWLAKGSMKEGNEDGQGRVL